jgi:hypothetical protein
MSGISYETCEQNGFSSWRFPSGASLGGKVSWYRKKQNIYMQGAPAYSLFYIQEGSCAAHHPNEKSTIGSYRDPGRQGVFWTSSASQGIPFAGLRPSR